MRERSKRQKVTLSIENASFFFISNGIKKFTFRTVIELCERKFYLKN